MYQDILTFWFQQLSPKDWFNYNAEVDQQIEKRFLTTLQQAQQSELFSWRKTAHGRLAEVIVLDQFSRNIYRNSPKAFAQDGMALALAQEAISLGLDKPLSAVERSFLYMPFMHSESKLIHQTAERLFKSLGQTTSYEFELKHKAIIDQFGRYPHRNKTLGRESTKQELKFLEQPNSSF